MKSTHPDPQVSSLAVHAMVHFHLAQLVGAGRWWRAPLLEDAKLGDVGWRPPLAVRRR